MNKFFVFALLLLACGCGGSSSETPPPLEPDPDALPAKTVRRLPPVPTPGAEAGTILEGEGARSEKPDTAGSRQMDEGMDPPRRMDPPPGDAEPPASTWGADDH